MNAGRMIGPFAVVRGEVAAHSFSKREGYMARKKGDDPAIWAAILALEVEAAKVRKDVAAMQATLAKVTGWIGQEAKWSAAIEDWSLQVTAALNTINVDSIDWKCVAQHCPVKPKAKKGKNKKGKRRHVLDITPPPVPPDWTMVRNRA
jgi:hypothetical protein